MAGSKNNRGPDDPGEDPPWTEAQWEAFLDRADLRAARFGELMETLIDDPDRNEIVAREMGWELDGEEEEVVDFGEDAESGDDDEPDADAAQDVEGESSGGAEGLDVGDPELEAIAAYGLANACADSIHAVIDPMMEEPAEDDGELRDAWLGMWTASAKIANAHGLGYEDAMICGNIVQLKKAMLGAIQARDALEAMGSQRRLEKAVAGRLVGECNAVIEAIEARIAELRARVWW